MSLEGYTVRQLGATDVGAAHQLETASYPQDEAATLEGMRYRQQVAGPYFYGLYEACTNILIGFVNGTCSRSRELGHETMSIHDAGGTTLCVHSVTIQEQRRRKGLGSALLKEYVRRLFATTDVTRIVLIAKAHLIGFYQACGFEFVRLSPVQHGQDKWFELALDRLSMAKGRPFVQVDAFTGEPFRGNPAAVVFLNGDESDLWMQRWGAEINLSETSMLLKLPAEAEEGDSDRPARWRLRWFTPSVEVDLCGHATLASAHALWESGRVTPPEKPIAFETKSGVLTATRGEGGWITLDFPATPPDEVNTESEQGRKDLEVVLKAFGCKADDVVYIGRSIYDVLVEVRPRAFTDPDIGVLAAIDCRGLIVTRAAVEGEDYDFVSRFFGPRCGIPEDPVTGSAHCCLGPHWALQLGKTEMLAYQSSPRGGCVRVTMEGDRVKLAGQATLVKQGYLCA